MRSMRISQDTHLPQIMHCSTTTCTMTPPLQVKLVEKPRVVSARSLSGCCSLQELVEARMENDENPLTQIAEKMKGWWCWYCWDLHLLLVVFHPNKRRRHEDSFSLSLTQSHHHQYWCRGRLTVDRGGEAPDLVGDADMHTMEDRVMELKAWIG
ncbi:hypothetical protein C1H46_030366 [Malus baccata]|uniref:Uncharacterized protein n=1 Tax=Malus baccata TaxID=106549 RepID=A0A540LC98_MALBA|nr:hypothetical protein C1H46_030366 [Malus baccata]